MAVTRVIVIGGSAGSIGTVTEIVRTLPAGLGAALCLVVHLSPQTRSVLPWILQNAGALTASQPEHGEPLRNGHIFVAPPDFHLILTRGTVQLTHDAKENHHRPAIDPLFHSAAVSFGANVTALLLSGLLDDGTAGLIEVKRRGGVVLVQDPCDTAYPDMPRNALKHVEADQVLKVSAMAKALAEQAKRPLSPARGAVAEEPREEAERIAAAGGQMLGEPLAMSCPECGAPMWDLEDGARIQFRCQERHVFSLNGLAACQAQALQRALRSALQTLIEKATLAQRLADRAVRGGYALAATNFQAQADRARQHAERVRQLLRDRPTGPGLGPTPPQMPPFPGAGDGAH